MSKVVILVPGTMGSELDDANGSVWPGDPFDWIFGYGKLPRLMAPALTPVGILRDFFGLFPMYQDFIDYLQTLGFNENSAPPTLYTCAYDWRLPLQNSTTALESVVSQARTDHGSGTEITLIGHSLGGLMCRYYLETGLYNASTGFGSVRQCVLMGVPNLGAPQMLSLARGDMDYLIFSASQARQIINQDGLAFGYQMLPAKNAEKVWENGGSIPLSSYDVLTPPHAAAMNLTSTVNFNSAINFRNALAAGTRPMGVRYFSFVGTRKKTHSGTLVDTSTPVPHNVQRIKRSDGGDGTVPLWSAWLPNAQGLAVGGEHTFLFSNGTVQNYLQQLLS